MNDLLKFIAYHEVHNLFWWNCDLHFFINCNDIFAWGCADAEAVSEADLPALTECVNDCKAVGCCEDDAMLLFISRKREMRPQGAVYKHLCTPSYALFNACGPHRESCLGNPIATPMTEESVAA